MCFLPRGIGGIGTLSPVLLKLAENKLYCIVALLLCKVLDHRYRQLQLQATNAVSLHEGSGQQHSGTIIGHGNL